MKIDSCIIVRNESENIDKLIKILDKFSNNIYIVDTGSEDDTLYKLYNCNNNKVHTYSFKWMYDFSKAKNYAFSLSTNSDYIFTCDANDEIPESLVDDILSFVVKKYDESLPNVITTSKIYEHGTFEIPILVKRIKHYKWVGIVKPKLNYSPNDCIKLPLNISSIIHKPTNNAKHNLENYKVMEENGIKFDIEKMLDYGIELQYGGEHVNAYLIFKDIFLNKNIEQKWRIDGLIYAAKSYYICYDQAPFSHTIEDLFNHYLKLNMPNHNAYQWIADYYYENGKIKESCDLYTKAYELDDIIEVKAAYNVKPKNIIYLLFQLVVTNWKLGDLNKAKRYNDIILSIEPDNKEALYNKENIFDDTE